MGAADPARIEDDGGKIADIYRRIVDAGIARKGLAGWCHVAASTITRNLNGDNLPKVKAAEFLLAHLESKPATEQAVRDLLAGYPSVIDDLKSCIQAILKRESEKRESEIILKRTRDPIIAGKLSRMVDAPVRLNFEIDITIGHDPDTVPRGHRPETARLSWEAELPPGKLWISFVASEAALRSEFREPNCIYRTIDDNVAELAKEGDDLTKTNLVLARLTIDGVECEGTIEWPGESKDVLRFCFEQPEGRRGLRSIEIHTKCRKRLDISHLNVKFDSYHIRDKCKISLTPPVPVESLRHFQFSGSNHLVSEHDELWAVKTIEGLNRFEAESREKGTLAGSGIFFSWELRYELMPVSDLAAVVRIAKRAGEEFKRAFGRACRGAELDEKFLVRQGKEGYLVGLHQSSTPKPADEDEPRRDKTSLVGFIACSRIEVGDGFGMHIDHVALLPEIQKHRRGQRLVARALAVAKARGAEQVSLVCYDKGMPMQSSFFTRLGFKPVDEEQLTPSEHLLLKQDDEALRKQGGAAPAKLVFMRHDLIGCD